MGYDRIDYNFLESTELYSIIDNWKNLHYAYGDKIHFLNNDNIKFMTASKELLNKIRSNYCIFGAISID